ncbi:hypothetical protein RFI_26258 [Reticulomyxa filosa]|uniref:Uncharacterized protein n=1 Tax=Reticulomyxa filosa TaxID=46433 RepID=X6MAS7_RETFI|nr:hypothetical protein RFI_26258 [Reticulomyxa filosa]|eukprot:ETO11118.1 hypothetical protein RFI_26258 [Reticulomyxa filosa]
MISFKDEVFHDKSKCFDLESIENDIRHTFVHGRRPLTFIIPLFEYRSGFDIHSCITTIETRHKKCKNAQFQSFWDKLNLSAASPLEKQKALGMLNDVIVYLYQNLNDLRVNMLLTELLENLQFEKKDWVLFSQRGYSNDGMDRLCVKHVGVLWHQLQNVVRSEYLDESSITPFVLKIYQQPLTGEAQAQIKKFVKKTSIGTMKELLKAWREIAYKQGQVKRDAKAEDFIHILKQYLRDHNLEDFPHQLLKWKHCAAAYECAHQKLQQDQSRKHSSQINWLFPLHYEPNETIAQTIRLLLFGSSRNIQKGSSRNIQSNGNFVQDKHYSFAFVKFVKKSQVFFCLWSIFHANCGYKIKLIKKNTSNRRTTDHNCSHQLFLHELSWKRSCATEQRRYNTFLVLEEFIINKYVNYHYCNRFGYKILAFEIQTIPYYRQLADHLLQYLYFTSNFTFHKQLFYHLNMMQLIEEIWP